MKKFKLALALPLLLVLAACGWTGTGVVSGKYKTEAYSYISYICSAYDSKGFCTVQMPIVNDVPEYYYLKVNSDEDGKMHEVSVNYDYWVAAKDGDRFDNRKKEK